MGKTSERANLPADIDSLRLGGKAAFARLLAAIEERPEDTALLHLLDQAYQMPRADVIGFTGPPGVGKSTLINLMLQNWRQQGMTVGVVAVDPSSHRTGGALLGDRIRMRTDPEDQGVFVRSLASRGALGGLTALAFPVIILMRAIYDRVIIETVGVGQSEADISTVADQVVLCVQPGSGDALQFMKAGIMEIPDIAVVTKADNEAQASRALADLKGAVGLANMSGKTQCLMLSAVTGQGVGQLHNALDTSVSRNRHLLPARRQAQASGWVRACLRRDFGETGLKSCKASLELAPEEAPFLYCWKIAKKFKVAYES